jgi:hypothetical protein
MTGMSWRGVRSKVDGRSFVVEWSWIQHDIIEIGLGMEWFSVCPLSFNAALSTAFIIPGCVVFRNF